MTETRDSKEDFKEQVREWGRKLKTDIGSVTVRPMKSKWASFTTKGRLTFNSLLLDTDKEIADYVIVRELLHFSVPNHGKLWKRLMRAHPGDYEAAEARLSSYANVPKKA
jgi:predicted metal-dependent hydrolase